MSTTKTELLRKIRHKCLDCVCEQPKEVELCPATQCPTVGIPHGQGPVQNAKEAVAGTAEKPSKGMGSQCPEESKPWQ